MSSPYNLDIFLDGVQEVVTSEMNTTLTTPYKAEEVEIAIKDMAPRMVCLLSFIRHTSPKLVWILLKLFSLVLTPALF